MVQLGHLPMVQHSLHIGFLKQNKHNCFRWIKSSLSFGTMSQNVGQLSGACFQVHPNTGNGIFFLLGGSAAGGILQPVFESAVSRCLAPVAVPMGVSAALVFTFFLVLAVAPLDTAVLSGGVVGAAGDTVEMGNIKQVFNFTVKLKILREVLLSMV
jgi:hypothetical protein